MNRDNSNISDEEITVESLQDLLIYDDMFLDYFNVFLKLPVFPQSLEYQRLTDSFKIIEEESESVVTCESPPPFMASEEDHDRLMEWAQKYRLPIFLKTDLFRQLKLAKVLLRQLKEFPTTSRNTFLRGYSKHSIISSFTSPTSSHSVNEFSSESTETDEDFSLHSKEKSKINNKNIENYFINEGHNQIPYDSYIRPGSEAISLPMQIETEKSMREDEFNRKLKGSKTNNGILDKSKAENSFLKVSRQRSMTFNYDDDDSLFFRIQSAPIQFDFADFDYVYTNKVLYAKHRVLNIGSSNEEEEEKITTELEAMEIRQKVSLYKLKGMIFGTSSGMNQFREFLKSTSGNCLCDFWLDCEEFKDTFNDRSENENNIEMNKLLRNLQDKYKLNLSKLAKMQLKEAMKNSEKITSLFIQAQYDCLRRLRGYWVPRYLLHQEALIRQHTLSDLFLLRNTKIQNDNDSVQSGIFPRLNLERTLPYTVTSIDIAPFSWNQINKFQNKKITETILSNKESREKSNYSSGILRRSVFQNRLRNALAIDNISGHPFKNFLQSFGLLPQMNNLEFYQEVGKFKFLTKRNIDLLLRQSHAWSIVKRFIGVSSKENISLSDQECEELIQNIKKSKSTIKDDLFDHLIESCIKKLEQEWLRYLKEDMKRFMESSLTHRDVQSPPRSLEEVEVLIEGETIVVRRKALLKDFETKLKTWDTLSKEERQKRREKALELNRITEIERQKVLKAVALRIKRQLEDNKRLKSMMSILTLQKTAELTNNEIGDMNISKENTMSSDGQNDVSVEDRTPEMKRLLENKVLLNLFKKYVLDRADTLDKESLNTVMLLHDLSGYFSIQGYDRATITKKDHKSNTIYKSYFDKSSKRYVTLNETIHARMFSERLRPKSPTLKDVKNLICFGLVDVFAEFWKYELKELCIKSNVLAAISENELEILAENQLNEINKNQKTKVASTAAHTKEDKNGFLLALADAAYGQLSLQMLHFYRYLVEHGPEDKMHNLDKDLFFYTEVLKLKEMCRTTVEEEITKKKLQCISISFLESVHPPTIQINIPNEMAQRAIRAVQRQLTNKEININVFDEISGTCLKTLLPYWAGFQRQWEESQDHLYRPVSKYQRMLERRKQIYNEIPIPKTETIILPALPKGTNLSTLTYTLNDGAKWKDAQEREGQDINNYRQSESFSDNNDNRKKSLTKKLVKGLSRVSISQIS